MNDNLLFGINEEGLTNLSLELLDYADEISTILSKINLKIEQLSDNCDGSAINAIKDKYHNFKQNYNVVKNNVNSYSNDLIALIQKAKQTDKNITRIFEEGITDLKQDAKKIENN